jgi:hypothetical protein
LIIQIIHFPKVTICKTIKQLRRHLATVDELRNHAGNI